MRHNDPGLQIENIKKIFAD